MTDRQHIPDTVNRGILLGRAVIKNGETFYLYENDVKHELVYGAHQKYSKSFYYSEQCCKLLNQLLTKKGQ